MLLLSGLVVALVAPLTAFTSVTLLRALAALRPAVAKAPVEAVTPLAIAALLAMLLLLLLRLALRCRFVGRAARAGCAIRWLRFLRIACRRLERLLIVAVGFAGGAALELASLALLDGT